ncbi:hypothetical protein JGI3_01742 [Candidatus Kryptobacter tengchongensis]|uniref:Uncharacterized protein n=1 Tax=Kryptobacter tengchongensis TaxID=1643429 RepID=A0A656DEA1_KRYT1|nr:hypothetical protein [Candidatus Kryptobacter tengchongensis]CUS79508.1 hypothetical protein JGI20_00611 [Candidatus Kryptobacter tengchongensis]CUS97629.1 hypothetical protein JGI25_00295 [Candidatus Kryptobacter tengchongensis]CUT04509.1 hypothetical protein JGI24_01507 [Candidatus Kryptobacter tengchongensis]CUU03638.1 hypothetical protein JGI2_01020 [Candidatus Kryptobacter tengchongensis]CUU08664.1 hypothetical protein JGI3_01742 [Candidatus Kryptobacter tengchongensis]
MKNLFQKIIIAFAKLRSGVRGKKIVNFTQAFQRARYIAVIMPREKEQFMIAYEMLKNIPGRYNITVIATSDFKEYFTIKKYRFIEVTEDSISIFGLPKKNFIKKIVLFRYDIAIDMSFNFDLFNAWLCQELNAGVKIGFKRDNADLFYNFQLAISRNTDLKSAYSGMIGSLSIF